jgi:predicted DNA-binding protein
VRRPKRKDREDGTVMPVRLPAELARRLALAASQDLAGRSMAQIIRAAIAAYLEAPGPTREPPP